MYTEILYFFLKNVKKNHQQKVGIRIRGANILSGN